jgi:hypothetical protein
MVKGHSNYYGSLLLLDMTKACPPLGPETPEPEGGRGALEPAGGGGPKSNFLSFDKLSA